MEVQVGPGFRHTEAKIPSGMSNIRDNLGQKSYDGLIFYSLYCLSLTCNARITNGINAGSMAYAIRFVLLAP